MSEQANRRTRTLPHLTQLRVIAYDRIVSDSDESPTNRCVTDKNFRRHLTILEQWGFTAITFGDYKLVIEGELDLPRRPIILTFDGGYLETHQIVFPAMKEFGMRGVVFVLGDRKMRTNTWNDPENISPAFLLEDQHILEMHNAGFEIGSNSMTHQTLTLLPKDKAREEILRSRMSLEKLLNAPVYSFAYPYGLLNEEVKTMVSDAGYSFACGYRNGLAASDIDSLHILRRRVGKRGGGIIDFFFRILGPTRLLH